MDYDELKKGCGTEQCYKSIFAALEKGGGIEKMVGTMAGSLQVPIAVVNPYGEIVADSYTSFLGYSEKDQKQEREAWIRMMEEYYMQKFEMDESDAGAIVEHLEERGIRILGAIVVKGGLEGFCITLHEEEEKSGSIINQLLCRGISISFGQREHIYSMRDSGIRQVVSKILLGNGKDLEYIPKVSDDVYEIYAAPPFLLALIETDKSENVNIWKLRKRFGEHFQDTLIYMEKSRIAVLFIHVDSERKKMQIYDYLSLFLEEEDCICGISETFSEREKIENKRKMVKRLLQIGSRTGSDKRLYTEYEYYMELVCSYAYEAMGESGCFQKELEILEQEDREKGTEFYKSLKEYLLMGNNVNLAAKKLFIHRNTMVYRLSKIHEMLNVDVNDPEVAKRLMLSMVLRTFQ